MCVMVVVVVVYVCVWNVFIVMTKHYDQGNEQKKMFHLGLVAAEG